MVRMQISMFRPKVLAARKDRFHGDTSLAVPLPWHAIGYLLFLAVALALVFPAFATYSRVESVSGAIVVEKVSTAIKMGSHLSGGQRKRALIARTLYRQLPLIVIDEGTSHLNLAAEDQILACPGLLAATRVCARGSGAIVAPDKQFFVAGRRAQHVAQPTENADNAMAPAFSVPTGAS